MDAYFVSLFAHNFPIALFLFVVVVFLRRNERLLTPLRGVAVFLIAWLGGSSIVFLIHVLFSMTGPLVGDRSIDGSIAIFAILPIVYLALSWLSEAKAKKLES